MPMFHHKSREWICTNNVSPTSLAYQSIPSTSDLRKGSAEEEKSCKTTGMHQYKGTLLCFLSVQQDANRHLYRSCFWKVVIYIILFPIYSMNGYPKWFLYKWMPSSFQRYWQKKVVLKSQKSPSHSDSSHWGFPWLLCRAMPTQLPAAPGGFMNPVGLGLWVQPMGSLPTAPAGQSSWQRKEPQQIAWFFLDVLGITWHWMKWHEITTWLGDFSGKAATSGSANILNTSDSLTAQCSTWPFFWVLRRNRCSMSVPKTPRRKMILFFVNFSCLFSFYGSSPGFMGGLLLLQTRSFGQTPLANVFSVYPWEKLIQDHNFYIKNVGTHLFK